MSRKIALYVAFALSITTAITGCGEDSGGSAASSSATTVAPETTTTTPNTTQLTSGTSTSVAATAPKRYLTGITTSRNGNHDVLEFTFDGGTPGFAAAYAAQPITDEGEGKTIPVAGANVMKLIFENAGTVNLTGGTKTYYNGPNRFPASNDTQLMTEIVKVSEYEGRLVWAIGTKSPQPFRTTTHDNKVTITFD